MKILMLTNTFTPHVGGVARSVASFTAEHRRRGHGVLVVAPEFEGYDRSEEGVIRFPAIQHFNGTDFSIPMPVPLRVAHGLEQFRPDVVHSHHPFLLGDTALRVAASRAVPLVFTHHTLYERYTHYVPGDSPALKRAAVDLAVGYCNLCDAVIAPSESIEHTLRQRGVESPIEAIPTGVETAVFAAGDRQRARRRCQIPPGAFTVGHVGRLAPEKNLDFLARAIARFLAAHPKAHGLVAGTGPSKATMVRIFEEASLGDRVRWAGQIADRSELADIYTAMDAFAFASQSETQGMVLAEAMAAGVPVVAVDAAGVREVVRDRFNGRLLATEDEDAFAEALAWVAALEADRAASIRGAVAETARRFSLGHTARRTRNLYRALIGARPSGPRPVANAWTRAQRRFAQELEIWRNVGHAAGATFRGPRGRRT